jgi:hypothetical protein
MPGVVLIRRYAALCWPWGGICEAPTPQHTPGNDAPKAGWPPEFEALRQIHDDERRSGEFLWVVWLHKEMAIALTSYRNTFDG